MTITTVLVLAIVLGLVLVVAITIVLAITIIITTRKNKNIICTTGGSLVVWRLLWE